MQHSFNVELAKQFGLLDAILLQHIMYWIEKNKANERHYYDEQYWTYNSLKAFGKLFPYATERKIQLALDRLVANGLIKCGNYNQTTYDRTKWYTITQYGYSILQNVKSNLQNDEPIPNKKPNKKPKEKDNDESLSPKKKFEKPSLEEVEKYCKERNNNVNAEKFLDYYDSNGWKVGKNSMKDWKAAIRTWERNDKEKQIKSQSYQEKKDNEQEEARKAFLNSD